MCKLQVFDVLIICNQLKYNDLIQPFSLIIFQLINQSVKISFVKIKINLNVSIAFHLFFDNKEIINQIFIKVMPNIVHFYEDL